MKIIPLFDRVLVTAKQQENITKSGLTITEDYSEFAMVGIIKNIGKNVNNDDDYQLKVNQKILFDEHTTSKFLVDNKPFYLLRKIDILAVLEEE